MIRGYKYLMIEKPILTLIRRIQPLTINLYEFFTHQMNKHDAIYGTVRVKFLGKVQIGPYKSKNK